MGRLEGKRRRVRYWRVVRIGKARRVRMILECGHVAHRRDAGAHPIWAICEQCPLEERLED
jgi:hypothetical protein